MAEYRLNTLDLSTHIALGLEMLSPAKERGWGRASELVDEYGISRSFLYQLKGRAEEALESRPKEEKNLRIDQAYLNKAIALMPVLTGSVRSIQTGLALLFGIKRSVGYISETLQSAGKAAADKNAAMRIPLPVLGEADEIFAGHKPCLTVVDGRSFLVLNLAASESRSATDWGMTFLDLADQGVVFQDLAADGAYGIRAGLRDAELAVPLRPDLFHLLREGTRLQSRLEKKAYKAINMVHRVQKAEKEAEQLKKRPGHPLKVTLSSAEATQMEEQALNSYDQFSWLLREIRLALEPVSNDYALQSPAQARETLEIAINLLKSLSNERIDAFAKQLSNHLDGLLAPLDWVYESLAPLCQHLPHAFTAWALASWQNGIQQLHDFPPHWQDTVNTIWKILALFHRSSSLAESLHSWLRPYLSIHRGMPDWLLPLLQLFWNHHVFSRGKRSGYSPLQLAGMENTPSLDTVFNSLLSCTGTV